VLARTSCRPLMALTSDALEMCAHALGTGRSCCTGRLAWLFFMLEDHGPQGTVGHVAAQSPPRSEARSRAMGHVAAGALLGRSEPQYLWQRRSPPYQGGGIWCRRTRGSPGAHHGWEAGSGGVRYVAACGCTPHSLS
jgi:hypothetical protein